MTDEDMSGHWAVLDHNACRNCRRPISLIKNIGWLHGGLPQYAPEDPTCEKAVPVDPRCPECGELVPGVPVAGGVHVLTHAVSNGVGMMFCGGSGAPVARPA